MPTVAIKESTWKQAEQFATREGFANVEAYVEDLIEPESHSDLPPSFSTKKELEAMISEALNDPRPGKIMTHDDYERIKADLRREFPE